MVDNIGMLADLEKQTLHAIETEQALLGALLVNAEKFLDIQSTISSEMFYTQKNRCI